MELDRQIEVLEKLKNQFEQVRLRSICDSLKTLLIKLEISRIEYNFIKNLLVENKPTETNQYKEFTEKPYWRGTNYDIEDGFWWQIATLHPATIQIRVNYLTALIENQKKLLQ